MSLPVNLTHEPCRYRSDADIFIKLTEDPAGYLEYVESVLYSIRRGFSSHLTPDKCIIGGTDGDFRSMPSELHHRKCITKIVKVVGTNNTQRIVRGKITVGKVLNLHPEENFVTDILEANILSSARTGILSILATKKLGLDLHSATVIGCGNVGFFCAYYLCSLTNVKKVTFEDLDSNLEWSIVKWFREKYPDIIFEPSSASDSLKLMDDLIICATSSKQPLFDPITSRANMIVSVGADTSYQRELNFGNTLQLLENFNLVVDSYDALNYGDCLAHKITPDQVKLLNVFDPFSAGNKKRNIFISTGNALFDNITVGYLCNNDK